MAEFGVLRRAVLVRMLREATVGDMRPLEELLPVDGERVLAAPAQLAARKAEAELDQRIKGLLLAAAALAQPALPSLPDASSVLAEDGLRRSIIQLFDATLSKHRLSLLKPLIESGSRALREATGGFIWARRRLDFQTARRCAAASTCFHTPKACGAACDAASFRAFQVPHVDARPAGDGFAQPADSRRLRARDDGTALERARTGRAVGGG